MTKFARPRQAFADVALLVTIVALIASLAVAATAVSIGIARADTLAQAASAGSRFVETSSTAP